MVSASHGNRRSDGVRLDLVFSRVVVFAAHFSVFGNTSLASFAAGDGTAHGKRNDNSNEEEHGGSQHKVRAKGHMRHEEENIDNE